MSYITGPHLDTGQWLKKLDLKEYNHIFKSYNGVEDILSMSECDLKSMGVKNGSHRTRMMASLILLRDKYDRGAQRMDTWILGLMVLIADIDTEALDCSVLNQALLDRKSNTKKRDEGPNRFGYLRK
ncbi:SAM domain-containing protein [Caerostris darwini]|uniref:SAM domain-containing protein n=1 Tax=Caerostris darwini TaxID=1538125 RepID=A0AAV4QWI9_9ARAC|nr:SAM domain-containing protein [Caerostris darwini]